MAYKVFSNGNTLPASDLNTYLMNQSVISFASTSARDAAIPAPNEGMLVWLENSNKYVKYTGSAWADLVDPIPSGNAIINGAFDIWQRGTSIATSTARVYTADRWNAWRGALVAGMTVSRQSSGSTGFQYAARVQRDSGNAGTQQLRFAQDIESINSIPFAGQTVTVSFYARAGANYSATSNALQVQVLTGTGTDQNIVSGYTGGNAFISQTATLTTSWQRFSYSAAVTSSATQLGVVFNFDPTGTAGAADYFEVTGVQLESGSTATSFKRNAPSIQAELAACQRYYVRFANGGNYAIIGNGYVTTSTNADINIALPVTMRVAPTSVDYSTLLIQDSAAGGYTISSVTVGSSYSSPFNANVACAITGGTSGRYARILNNNSTAGYIGFSAEL